MSDLAIQENNIPVPNTPKRGKKGDSARRKLAAQGALQIDSAIENARAIVGETSDIVASVYNAVPAMIEVEAATKVEAQLPLTEAENARRLQVTKASVKEAVQDSRQIASEFLKEYGIDL
ncbi:hypothetical protein NIES2135_53860 [Leptolyngbya boryana NIES-2135]|uniref:Uncharacterized protein n=1 Tax=Leptolyngbya boryana NIES-2135 TaxID=1973484 RepID=A0A1Z4JPD1_LEPBY|nr:MULTISPECIES: hypothetical protein [Leptolyngbya]BAY58513.1 hypothetical protein NIES2135_53860 [Leptolyngbya boryana NIES-2135]MBD2370988.1 hypothetical protein [Leptolyngbya sp. FACHB-161]MBD2377502.1 hypothetical protein [Leptolyngbya sp. FACHB-238]MBD2401911.1 hypothetical protein [Leptolyngbya sp. FACHB-239]MBD2408428.1 hypothetical protein [Leptolyngbya sp. FACHB-402]